MAPKATYTTLLLCSLILSLSLLSAAYTVPQKIPLQGRLSNASTGVVLSGEYDFTFRIYNASSSGTLLWDENQTLTVDGNGLWNALLGNNTSLSLNFSEDTYLEVELNHDGSPLPRVQLGSTPYAEWTDTASNLSCTDCLGTTEIEDVYLLNSGDNATGDYMFNGSFKVENSSGSLLLYVNSSDGKVGIGTTSPSDTLTVKNPDTGFILRFNGTTGTDMGGWYEDSSHNSEVYIRNNSGGNAIVLDSVGNSYFNGGNVGIGTTNPGHDLHINETSGAGSVYIEGNTGNAALYLDSGGSSQDSRLYFYDDGVGKWLINYEEPLGNLEIYDYGIGSDVFAIQNGTGNVGIGTTSPDVNLHITNTNSSGIKELLRLENTGTGSGTGSALSLRANADTEHFKISTVDVGGGTYKSKVSIGWNTGGGAGSNATTGITLDSTGNVGIGTTSPGVLFDVGNGTSNNYIRFYGSVTELYFGQNTVVPHFGLTNTSKIMQVAGYPLVVGTYSAQPLYFGTHNAITMTILDGGNVGIGTTSPSRPLHVSSSLDVVAKFASTDAVTGIELNDTGGSAYIYGKSGYVGIGNSDPNDALDVTGDIDATGCVQTDDSGSIGGTCISDVRLKSNVQPLTGSLDKISRLNPVSFQWDPDQYNISLEEGRGVGLIAQELEEVYPELVVTGVDGYKRVRYDIELEMHLIQAVKELKEEDERKDVEMGQLREENEALQAENAVQQEEIGQLKALVCSDHPESYFCRGVSGV